MLYFITLQLDFICFYSYHVLDDKRSQHTITVYTRFSCSVIPSIEIYTLDPLRCLPYDCISVTETQQVYCAAL